MKKFDVVRLKLVVKISETLFCAAGAFCSGFYNTSAEAGSAVVLQQPVDFGNYGVSSSSKSDKKAFNKVTVKNCSAEKKYNSEVKRECPCVNGTTFHLKEEINLKNVVDNDNSTSSNKTPLANKNLKITKYFSEDFGGSAARVTIEDNDRERLTGQFFDLTFFSNLEYSPTNCLKSEILKNMYNAYEYIKNGRKEFDYNQRSIEDVSNNFSYKIDGNGRQSLKFTGYIDHRSSERRALFLKNFKELESDFTNFLEWMGSNDGEQTFSRIVYCCNKLDDGSTRESGQLFNELCLHNHRFKNKTCYCCKNKSANFLAMEQFHKYFKNFLMSDDLKNEPFIKQSDYVEYATRVKKGDSNYFEGIIHETLEKKYDEYLSLIRTISLKDVIAFFKASILHVPVFFDIHLLNSPESDRDEYILSFHKLLSALHSNDGRFKTNNDDSMKIVTTSDMPRNFEKVYNVDLNGEPIKGKENYYTIRTSEPCQGFAYDSLESYMRNTSAGKNNPKRIVRFAKVKSVLGCLVPLKSLNATSKGIATDYSLTKFDMQSISKTIQLLSPIILKALKDAGLPYDQIRLDDSHLFNKRLACVKRYTNFYPFILCFYVDADNSELERLQQKDSLNKAAKLIFSLMESFSENDWDSYFKGICSFKDVWKILNYYVGYCLANELSCYYSEDVTCEREFVNKDMLLRDTMLDDCNYAGNPGVIISNDGEIPKTALLNSFANLKSLILNKNTKRLFSYLSKLAENSSLDLMSFTIENMKSKSEEKEHSKECDSNLGPIRNWDHLLALKFCQTKTDISDKKLEYLKNNEAALNSYLALLELYFKKIKYDGYLYNFCGLFGGLDDAFFDICTSIKEGLAGGLWLILENYDNDAHSLVEKALKGKGGIIDLYFSNCKLTNQEFENMKTVCMEKLRQLKERLEEQIRFLSEEINKPDSPNLTAEQSLKRKTSDKQELEHCKMVLSCLDNTLRYVENELLYGEFYGYLKTIGDIIIEDIPLKIK